MNSDSRFDYLITNTTKALTRATTQKEINTIKATFLEEMGMMVSDTWTRYDYATIADVLQIKRGG